jgi:uncharacterized protein DUF6602
MQDCHGYLRSFADELAAQANRVRSLIGERHWLSDGTHKEHVLAALFERHLPSGVLLTKGFVADLQIEDACSKEQDLLFLDTTVQAPLFHQGGLAVSAPDAVLATVSVKSTMTAATITKTIENQNSVRRVVHAAAPHRQLLTAGYFFAIDDAIRERPALIYDAYERGCREHLCPRGIEDSKMPNPAGPDILCAAGSLVIRARGNAGRDSCNVRLVLCHSSNLG